MTRGGQSLQWTNLAQGLASLTGRCICEEEWVGGGLSV